MDKILRDKKAIFVFIAPALIMFLLVLIIPTIQMVYYSLCDYAALTPPEFVGLKNYKKLFFGDATFRIALKNSIFFMIFSAVTQQIFGLLLAVMLTNIPKGRNIFKNIYYLPCVLSSAALGLLWSFLGQNMMLYMAQITGISRDIYEASYIDGASKVKAFRYITLPLIKPMMITSLSLNCIGSLKFFDLVYNMTQGGPNHATEYVSLFIFTEGFSYGHMGYACAASWIILLIMVAVTGIIFKTSKAWVFYGDGDE